MTQLIKIYGGTPLFDVFNHRSSVFQFKISILTLSRVQIHGNSLGSLEERMVYPN